LLRGDISGIAATILDVVSTSERDVGRAKQKKKSLARLTPDSDTNDSHNKNSYILVL
jgi:hypothetical protein